MPDGGGGAAAKRKAVAKLGLESTTKSLVALCTDAFSEGLNLQRASCVVHLDTPTVIRLAEQRAGRVDRMNSPHDEVEIWWPKDAAAFAPRRRDLLRVRHEVVRDLIGANLALPDEVDDPNRAVTAKELADGASIEAAEAELDATHFYDAFRAVRELVGGKNALVPKHVYDHMRTSQAEVVACVSLLKSTRPWCFMSVGGLERAAPRWVFLDDYEAELELDLGNVAAELRKRLTRDQESRERDDRSDLAIENFITRLREREHDLLPIRRRRALTLLDDVTEKWMAAARSANKLDWLSELRELREWLCFAAQDRRVSFPDPGSIADAWLRLLRPRLLRALESRRGRRKPWRLNDLLQDLLAEPIPTEQIWHAFEGVQT